MIEAIFIFHSIYFKKPAGFLALKKVPYVREWKENVWLIETGRFYSTKMTIYTSIEAIFIFHSIYFKKPAGFLALKKVLYVREWKEAVWLIKTGRFYATKMTIYTLIEATFYTSFDLLQKTGRVSGTKKSTIYT